MRSEKLLFCDVDGVLADVVSATLKRYKILEKVEKITRIDERIHLLKNNKVIEESIQRLIINSLRNEDFLLEIPTYEGSDYFLNSCKELGYDITFLTCRREKNLTKKWLETKYPFLDEYEIISSKEKWVEIPENGSTYFVDDYVQHLLDVEKRRPLCKTILVRRYWSGDFSRLKRTFVDSGLKGTD